ncbi:hypothetical protein ACO2Q1_04605 [Brevundimonas sp. VNH65]|uniref:hypothetical protein n=1 Tax=Brevundimonas sp. VNH65 TaxID=3400917 RepID=UPI003C12413F
MTGKPDAADIAYIRALAEEGRTAPPLNGPILIAAAVIFGAASVGQWAIQSGVLDVTPWAQLWIWVGAGVIFAVALAVLINRMKSKPGYGHVRNEAIGEAWFGVGLLIFTVWLGLMAMGFTTGDWTAMRIMPSLVFAAYGSAWLIAGAMGRTGWMKGVAFFAYAGAVVLGAVSHMTIGYLVFAVLLVAVALVPGIVLTRQEPSEIV